MKLSKFQKKLVKFSVGLLAVSSFLVGCWLWLLHPDDREEMTGFRFESAEDAIKTKAYEKFCKKVGWKMKPDIEPFTEIYIKDLLCAGKGCAPTMLIDGSVEAVILDHNYTYKSKYTVKKTETGWLSHFRYTLENEGHPACKNYSIIKSTITNVGRKERGSPPLDYLITPMMQDLAPVGKCFGATALAAVPKNVPIIKTLNGGEDDSELSNGVARGTLQISLHLYDSKGVIRGKYFGATIVGNRSYDKRFTSPAWSMIGCSGKKSLSSIVKDITKTFN